MTSQPVFSSGRWWSQAPDGSWLAWDEDAKEWCQPNPELSNVSPSASPGPVYPTYPPSTYDYGRAPSKTNPWSTASLVLGLLWIWWVGAVLGVVFGLIALREIKRSDGREGGRGLAIAGITLGSVWIGLGLMGLAARYIDL